MTTPITVLKQERAISCPQLGFPAARITRGVRAAAVALFALTAAIGPLPVWGADDGVELHPTQTGGASAARLRRMRVLADDVTLATTPNGKRQVVERIPEPIFRLNDPARRFIDGTIWAWGTKGRPSALLTVSKEPMADGGFIWLHELASLSPGPLVASRAGDWTWSPYSAGVTMHEFSQAPEPAADESKRLRQMRDLVRGFKPYEIFGRSADGRPERFELRTLPQAVHRYSDPESGLIDGAIFVLAYNLNPEILLLVEAQQTASRRVWNYGFVPNSLAELHVERDGREIWRHPNATGPAHGQDRPYWVFSRPAATEE